MLQIKSKKLLLGTCFFVLFSFNTFGQVTNDYRTKASGAWSAFATVWERFNGTAWVAATASPTSGTAQAITILSPHNVNVGAAASADQLTIANGATITVDATFTLTIANGTGTDLTVSAGGNIINNGTITLNGSTASSNSGTITNSGTISPVGTLTHAAGGLYRHSFSSAAATVGVIPTSTWNATSTCEILACGNTGSAPTGINQSFGHFIWNNTTQPVDVNLNGLLTAVTGNFTSNSTNGFNLIFKTNTGGNTTVGGIFTLNGGNLVISKIIAPINTTNQLSVNSYSQTGGTMTIVNSSGTLATNTGNGTLSVTNTSSISGGTLNVCTSAWVGAGGNGTFSSGGLITISGTGVVNGCSSSAVSSGGSAGLITATSGITISGGTLNLNSASTTGSGGSTILNASGAVTVSGGTLNLAAGPAIASTGCNGTINVNSGGFTISSGTLNVCSSSTTGGGGLGILNVAVGNFIHSGGTVSKTGSNTGSININGSTAQQIRSSGFTTGHAISLNISQNTAAAGTTTISTALTIASGTTLNINDNSLNTTDFTPGMNFTNNGVVNLNASAELDMATFVMSGTGNFTSNTNSLLSTRHATGISATAGLGCIQVTGTKTFASDGNYTYYGNASQVTGDGLPSTLNGGILTINNSVAAATGGVTLTRATTILEGTSTTGSLVLTAGRFITTATNLITIGDDVIVTSAVTNSRFIDGPIKKIGDDAFIFPTGDVYLATGAVLTAKGARIEIAAPSLATDAFTAEYHKLPDPCSTNQAVSNVNGAGIDHVSYKEYWDLTLDAGSSTPHVRLHWLDGSSSTSIGSGISLLSDLRVAEFYSAQWNNHGVGTTTGTTGAGSVSSGTTPVFTLGTVMNFTFSSAAGVNPLPVELLTFDGLSTIDGNQLFWSTATETNNDYFNLERSIDGSEFTSITKIAGNGNSTSTKNYEYLDVNPINGVNYYRLKQVDYDGNFSYSNIISLKNDFNESIIEVFPNPCQDVVNIVASDNFSTVTIYNTLGELVFSSSSSRNTIQFNPLGDGLYVVKATTKNGKEVTTRFIKN